MIATNADKVSVKLDGEHVPFRDVKVTIREIAPPAFINNSLDIQLTLASGEIIHDGGGRVEVIVET